MKQRRATFILAFQLLTGSVNFTAAQNDVPQDIPVEINGEEVTFKYSSVFGSRGSRTRTLKPKDIKSFQWIDGAFSKDKYLVYYFDRVLSSADPASFTCLSKVDDYHALDAFPSLKSSIGIDNNSIFIMPTFNIFLDSVIHGEEIVPRKGFKILSVLDSTSGIFLVQGGKNMYELRGDMYMRPKIREYPFRAGEYQILGGCFIRSGQYVYYGTFPMEGIDPAKFKTFRNSLYYQHDQRIFYREEYSETEVSGADASSFDVHRRVNRLSRDKNKCYFRGREIDSIKLYPARAFFEGSVPASVVQELINDLKN